MRFSEESTLDGARFRTSRFCDPFVLEMLDVHYHGLVKMAWSRKLGRWCVVQRAGNVWRLALVIQDREERYARPNINNTVLALRQIDLLRKCVNAYQKLRYLSQIEQENERVQSRAIAKFLGDRREGADRIYDRFIGKIAVAPAAGERKRRRRRA